MKRFALIALFVVGCGETLDGSQSKTSSITGDWAVTVNRGDPSWSCAGSMHLTISRASDMPTSVSGTWTCGNLGGSIDRGVIAPNQTIAFDIASDPNTTTRFLGVMDGMKFLGHAVILGGELPLIATPVPAQ